MLLNCLVIEEKKILFIWEIRICNFPLFGLFFIFVRCWFVKVTFKLFIVIILYILAFYMKILDKAKMYVRCMTQWQWFFFLLLWHKKITFFFSYYLYLCVKRNTLTCCNCVNFILKLSMNYEIWLKYLKIFYSI